MYCPLRTLLLSSVLVVIVSFTAQAGITGFTATANPGFVVGKQYTYTIQFDGQLGTPPPPATGPFRLRWRAVDLDTGTFGPWSEYQYSNDSIFSTYEDRVGSKEYEAGVYSGMQATPPNDPIPPSWTSRTTIVGIAGPDSDAIRSGLNVDSEGCPWMTRDVLFDVFSGTMYLTSPIDGYVQERIWRFEQDVQTWVPQKDEKGNTWTSAPGMFFWQGDAIFDRKELFESPDFDNAAVGETVLSIRQDNRFVIKDVFGNDKIFRFKLRQFDHIKTGDCSFKIVETAIP